MRQQPVDRLIQCVGVKLRSRTSMAGTRQIAGDVALLHLYII
jgi:hypothetical protein